MRRFEIVDGSKRRAVPCAVLEWDDEESAGIIRIAEGATPETLPLSLALIREKGECVLGERQTQRWIEERIVPSGRQNLGQVLKAHGLDFYDAMTLLMAHEGRCAQDDFYLREVGEGSAEGTVKVGALFKDARQQIGYSQYELAKRAGVQQSLISRLENDGLNPTVKLLSDVAAALGKELIVSLE